MSEMTEVAGAEAAMDLRGAILAMREDEAAAVWVCPECRDTGLVVTGDFVTGQMARPCACGMERAARRRLERARLPVRYAEATLETLRTAGMDPSVGLAARMAREMAQAYPLGRGMLLHGTCGTGKTHLAISILRYLVMERGAAGRFWDLGDLLATIKRSYNGGGGESEQAVMDGLAAAEVLVLDELGAQRLTDWSQEAVALVLNTRYNRRGMTVLTTNYPNLPAGAGKGGAETLGDRIGTRMWSRLQEMTTAVEMTGLDYRTRRGA